MSTLAELHERWSRDPDYREAYEQLGPEYEVARALIEARTRAGLTQAELAARMKTTQSASRGWRAVVHRRPRGRWRKSREQRGLGCESSSTASSRLGNGLIPAPSQVVAGDSNSRPGWHQPGREAQGKMVG